MGETEDLMSPKLPLQTKFDVEFRNLRFTVPSKKSDRPPTVILKSVSGACRGCRLTAIMGASGAGKTTLLNALACKMAGKGSMSGRVLLNGVPYTDRDFRRWGVYVMQAEPLLNTATVKETIMTSALLQLPLSMSKREKHQRVTAIIDQLGLQHCQDTLMGDEGTGAGVRGVSGGERKRVTVGIGLVTQPKVLMLDEPTSGLDSETAVAIMQLMQDLTRQGRTVVTTIHQPNTPITECFDDLLLLSHGTIMYMGEWSESVQYFSGLGYRCPNYTNPTDYFMMLMKNEESSGKLLRAWRHADATAASKQAPLQVRPFSKAEVALDAHVKSEEPLKAEVPHREPEPGSARALGQQDECASAPLQDGHAKDIETGCTDPASSASSAADPGAESEQRGSGRWGSRIRPFRLEHAESTTAERRKRGVRQKSQQPPWWYQVWVLAIRNCRMYIRNPELLGAKLVTYICMGAFMGSMYLRQPLDTATAAYNRSAALWVAMFAFMLMPSETACSVWCQERAVITKEVKSGQYRLISFYLARQLVSVPFESAIALLFTVIVYFMIGFQTVAAKYFIFAATLLLVNLISEMVGFIMGVILKEVAVGLIVNSVIIYFSFAFSGFIVQPIPKYWVWLHKMSYFSIAYTILVKNEFTGLSLHSPIDPQCSAELNFIPPPPANSFSIAQNLGLLALIAVGIRVIAFAVLYVCLTPLPGWLRRPLAKLGRALHFCFC